MGLYEVLFMRGAFFLDTEWHPDDFHTMDLPFVSFILLDRVSILVWDFSKTMKNLKFMYENFPNQSLGLVKHFKHVFGVGVGWEFEKMWIKIKNIRA